MNRGKVIIVEGIIGAGKTSFSKELAQMLGDETLYLQEPDEENDANPYLKDFYGDQARWAYTMQTHLLQERFKMHLHAQWHAMTTGAYSVLDRSYFGDTAFARLQLSTGAMTQREFDTYQSIYHAMTSSVLLPTVCIHLLVSPSVAQKRIQRRMETQTGRTCENVIDIEYLEALVREEKQTVDALESQGVRVLSLKWDEDRATKVDRSAVIRGIAEVIKAHTPPDMFLDLHRRTI